MAPAEPRLDRPPAAGGAGGNLTQWSCARSRLQRRAREGERKPDRWRTIAIEAWRKGQISLGNLSELFQVPKEQLDSFLGRVGAGALHCYYSERILARVGALSHLATLVARCSRCLPGHDATTLHRPALAPEAAEELECMVPQGR